jgi:hypothetical protein
MEGSQLFPSDRSAGPTEQKCPECGQSFEPVQLDPDNGSEQLCETCYQAQFEPLHLAKWQRLAKQPRNMRPHFAGHVGRRSRPASAA